MTEPYRVLIVGAGLSGLTAAIELTASPQPIEVTVVDKGRAPGGRLATRRMGRGLVDHGAQFFTVRSGDFGQWVDRWLNDGVAEEWCRGFDPVDGYPRYRIAGGMSALARHLAAQATEAGARVVSRQQVAAIIPGADGWSATYEAGSRDVDEVDAVIATPPVPQVVELLRSGAAMPGGELGARLESMAYHKVVALLVVVDRSPGLPEPGALQRPDHPTFSFVADNQAKGISDAPVMTFHLSHGLSDRLWDRPDAEILAAVDGELSRTIGEAEVVDVQIKRWRHAGPVTPATEHSLLIAERPGPLVAAGDGFAGAKIEGAFLSGLDAARHLLDRSRR